MTTRYQRGKIYCIRSPHTEQVYIGSTCQKTLALRMASHRRDLKKWKAGKGRYTTSFKILEAGDAYIELVEQCPCDSKDELLKREGHIIRITDCVNRYIAGRTKNEYRHDNKEAETARHKQYYQNNKEAIKANKNQKTECLCGGRYTLVNRATHFKTKKHKNYLAANIEPHGSDNSERESGRNL